MDLVALRARLREQRRRRPARPTRPERHRLRRGRPVRPPDPAASSSSVPSRWPPPANPADPADASASSAQPSRSRSRAGRGSSSIRDRDRQVHPDGDADLEVVTDRPGDFSTYTLRVDRRSGARPRRSRARFSLQGGLPDRLRLSPCRRPAEPLELNEPLLDYLAKDYASFRRLLLDLLPHAIRGWIERNPADLGMALSSCSPTTGDQLSYFQDAVANEAYLDTVRHRVSARRHARLSTTGCTTAATPGPSSTSASATRAPCRRRRSPHPDRARRCAPSRRLPGDRDPGDITVEALDGDPALRAVVVFETAHGARARSARTTSLRPHLGQRRLLPAGGHAEAYLFAVAGPGRAPCAPALAAGDYLLLEEVRGPRDRPRRDADPPPPGRHRSRRPRTPTTRSTRERCSRRRCFSPRHGRRSGAAAAARHAGGRPTRCAFPLCLSARPPDDRTRRARVGRARQPRARRPRPITTSETRDPALRRRLESPAPARAARGPLTMEREPADRSYDPLTARPRRRRDGSAATLRAATAGGRAPRRPSPRRASSCWTPVPDLLDSTAVRPSTSSPRSTTTAGAIAALRRRRVRPRGRRRDRADGRLPRRQRPRRQRRRTTSLVHVARPGGAAATGRVQAVRNPARRRRGGVDAETIEEVRQLAPDAFRAEQFRAVTEADYEAAALKLARRRRRGGDLPLDRQLATPSSSASTRATRRPRATGPTGRTRLRPAFERARPRHAHPLPARRLRPRAAAAALRAARDRRSTSASRAGHFRGDVLRRRPRRARQPRPARRQPRLLPPRRLHLRPAGLPRAGSTPRSRRVDGVDSAVVSTLPRATASADNGELEPACSRSARWRSRGSTTTRTSPRTACCASTVGGGKG